MGRGRSGIFDVTLIKHSLFSSSRELWNGPCPPEYPGSGWWDQAPHVSNCRLWQGCALREVTICTCQTLKGPISGTFYYPHALSSGIEFSMKGN